MQGAFNIPTKSAISQLDLISSQLAGENTAIRDEFLMGEDLLVAPVVEKGATSRKVVIPPGTWKADDGTVFTGPTSVTIAAPLARLPHFTRVRAASAKNL